MKQGWEIKKLGEVCELSAGGDVPKDNFSENKTEKYSIPIYANGEKNEGLYGYTNIAKVSKPSITVSARGTIGFSVKRLEAFFPVVRLIVVTPKNHKELELDFLDYSLQRIDFKHSGSSIPQLTVPMIRDYEIPLPPLPEQQRIVSILDEAFAAIAKAKDNAEQNLKNAKELFESYLQGVFEKKGDGWEEKKLGEVVDIINGRNQSQVISENGKYPIYGSAANLMGYATEYLCEKGTTIIGRKGNISNPIYIEERFWNVDTAFGLFPKNGYDTKFIHYLCRRIDFKSRNRGTTIPSLVKSDLLSIDVPFSSSLKQQQTIVRQLDALRAETQKLEAVYQKKIDDLDELKKSILAKAFAGELRSPEGAASANDGYSPSENKKHDKP